MKSTVHIKMTTEERAKQFMPFAALKGYEEALREVEKEREQSADSIVAEKIYDEIEYYEEAYGDR